MTANELIYLLVGAGLALGGQLVLQLRIVPRVEARKRREDRWERDVRELGEVLTDELPDRASAAEFAQWAVQLLNLQAKDRGLNKEQTEDLMREHSAKARESIQRFDAIAETRISWLVKLIVGLAPQSDELAAFQLLHTRYWLSTRVCTLFKLPYDNFDHDEYQTYWNSHRDLAQQLTEAVEELIGNPPPRNPRWLRHRWNALVAWSKKQLQAKDAKAVARETNEEA